MCLNGSVNLPGPREPAKIAISLRLENHCTNDAVKWGKLQRRRFLKKCRSRTGCSAPTPENCDRSKCQTSSPHLLDSENGQASAARWPLPLLPGAIREAAVVQRRAGARPGLGSFYGSQVVGCFARAPRFLVEHQDKQRTSDVDAGIRRQDVSNVYRVHQRPACSSDYGPSRPSIIGSGHKRSREDIL